MKWIIMTALVGLSTFVGYKAGGRYTVRDKLYADLVLFTDYYIAQIKYKGNTVKKIMEDYTGGSEIKDIFTQYVTQAANSPDIQIKQIYLKKNELENIRNFFSELGRSDAAAQTDTVKGYRDIFSERQTFCREEKKKFGGLFIKLGLLLGLLLAIIIA